MRCGSSNLVRLVSRVRVIRSAEPTSESESLPDDAGFDDELLREMESLDENDPRALGRFMRKMAAAANEDLGPEFEEIVGRLEKGEDPESIEQKMGDILGIPPAGDEEDAFDVSPSEPAMERESTEKSDTESDTKQETTRRTIAMGGAGQSSVSGSSSSIGAPDAAPASAPSSD